MSLNALSDFHFSKCLISTKYSAQFATSHLQVWYKIFLKNGNVIQNSFNWNWCSTEWRITNRVWYWIWMHYKIIFMYTLCKVKMANQNQKRKVNIKSHHHFQLQWLCKRQWKSNRKINGKKWNERKTQRNYLINEYWIVKIERINLNNTRCVSVYSKWKLTTSIHL